MTLLSMVVGGCASHAPSRPAATQSRHEVSLKQRREREARAQELRERKLVLETRRKLIADASSAVLPSKLPAKLNAAPKPALASLPPTPIAVTQEQTGEHYLYSKILETYRTKNSAELARTLSLLMKSYPESVFADNAVYLQGKLAFEAGEPAKALEAFDRILRDFPRSHKAVSALFAKALIQKRLGHTGEAKREFIQVRDFYPGSPEAARVSVELQLLVKRRES